MNYEGMTRIVYGDEGATFVPVCIKCGRFVKADKEISFNSIFPLSEACLGDTYNCDCSRCGRSNMVFEGFI